MDEGKLVGDIRVLDVYPADIRRGDYVQRRQYRSLKVTATKRLGAVWRIAGVSSDVGTDVIYPLDEHTVRVVRGFPASTLPEADAPRMLRVMPEAYGVPEPSGDTA